MPKMLQLITLSEFGGASRVLTSLLNYLPKEYDTTLMTGCGDELLAWLNDEAKQRIRHLQLKSLVRSISPLKDILALWQLYKFMKKEKFDIVHCHSSKAGVLGRIAAKLAGVPKIYFTVHGWVMDESQSWIIRTVYTLAEKLASLCSTKIICVSEADRQKALKYNITYPSKLTVIHNGIEQPKGVKCSLRDELNLTQEKYIVLMVARLAPPKLPLLFLQAAQELAKHKELVFVLVGGGKLYSECKQYINKHRLKNVFLLGEKQHAGIYFHDADLAVLLSEHEGLPIAVLEAMFAAKPVLASNVGGIPELIDDGENGYIVENTAKDIARRVEELFFSRTKGEEMGEKGLLKAQQSFSIDTMIKKYLELYSF